MRSLLVLCLVFSLLTACDRAAPPAQPPAAETPPPAPSPAPATLAYTRGYAVELAPQQTEAELRAAADANFADVVSVERLFPDVDPGDDPEGLSRIWRVRVADPPATDAGAWDQAYALQERGGFVRVEPDTEDTLVEAQKRSAVAACFGDHGIPAPDDPSWSLRAMRVPQARALAPPPGGKALGEGVRVCHPDSGWTDHVDLDAARIDRSASLNLMEGGSDARDPLGYQGNPGHGTKTGSVIVSDGGFGSDSGTTPPGTVTGLAPKATLVPIRTFNSVVRVLDSNTARAVRHATRARSAT